MKIYVDDERDLPKWMEKEGGWTLVRTPLEFRNILNDFGLHGIEVISFDNDLGVGCEEGRHLLNLVEMRVREWGEPCPELHAHTANPSAQVAMYQCIRGLERDFPRKGV